VDMLQKKAAGMGLSLWQLAVSLNESPDVLNVLTVATESAKMDKCLKLYEVERDAMLKKCMVLAGYSEDQMVGPEFDAVSKAAWQRDGKQFNESGSLPATNNTDKKQYDQYQSAKVHTEGQVCLKEPRGPICQAGKHLHSLDGSCGHIPVIHHPEGRQPHIDFVVGGKLECYEGLAPTSIGNEAKWPSRYRCNELEEVRARGKRFNAMHILVLSEN